MPHKITIINIYVNLSYNIKEEKSKYFYPADCKKNAPSGALEYVSVFKNQPSSI